MQLKQFRKKLLKKGRERGEEKRKGKGKFNRILTFRNLDEGY